MTRILKERTFSGTKNPQELNWEKEHRKIARRAAADGMVLLKNEGHILPLRKGSAVALYGAGAGKTIKGGTGSGDVNERETVSIYQGMINAGYQITTKQWIKDYDRIYDEARQAWKDDIQKRAAATGGGTMDFFSIYSTTPFQMPTGPAIFKEKDERTDTAIYVISRIAGEGADRFAAKGDYYLKDDEHKMLEDICNCYENVIVVINAGAQIDLSFMSEFKNIKALLTVVQPGMEGGNAFADILSGQVNPSGKLVDTWAFHYDDYPNSATFSHNNKDINTEVYEEGIYVGYRYFDTFQIPVRYGFGYGLSYTDFELSPEVIEKSTDGNLQIMVKVKNTGKVPGREVVQIYVSLPQEKLEKESRRLVAFQKTKNLQPGEGEILQIEVKAEHLTYYDEKMASWILQDGSYGIWIGNSLNDAKLCACAELDQRVVWERNRNICPVQQEIHELSQNKENKVEYDYSELTVVKLDAHDYTTRQTVYRDNRMIYDEEAMQFVNEQLTVEDLMHLASGDPGKAQGGNLGAAGISVPGSAGETHNCAVDRGLASIVLADGPAGLRLMKYYHVHEGKIVQMPFEFSLEGGLFYDVKEELPGTRYYQYCTAIPVGTLLAQTWDTELVKEVGNMIGKEMSYFGVTLWLAPGMNIHRNPLCGRNFEYYSEDPLVAGMIAAAMTNGVQENKGCGTTIKHFACNNQEDNRMGSDSVLSERALREIYLKGFEIAVKESHPMSIMTSYNLINGVHAANNYDLCTNVARNEWGFDGLIMTDWTTTEQDDSCTAAGCMRAGNDLVMPGCFGDQANLKKELEEGTLDISELKACIARLVSVCWKSNQYE